MTTARCPIVQDIEEDIALNGESFRGPIMRERYEQIRAALEAAQEMAEWLDIYPEHPAREGMERYRAATRGEK